MSEKKSGWLPILNPHLSNVLFTWYDVTKPNCQHCYEGEVECIEEGEIFFEVTEMWIGCSTMNWLIEMDEQQIY